MEFLYSPNVAAAVVAGVISLMAAFLIARYTDGRRVSHTASEKEVEARAAYVSLLQDRVVSLEGRIDGSEKYYRERLNAAEQAYREAEERYRQREREAEEKHRRECFEMERRWRHLGAALVQWALILKIKLEEKGDQIPPFGGFDKFEEEGGNLPEQWKLAGLSSE